MVSLRKGRTVLTVSSTLSRHPEAPGGWSTRQARPELRGRCPGSSSRSRRWLLSGRMTACSFHDAAVPHNFRGRLGLCLEFHRELRLGFRCQPKFLVPSSCAGPPPSPGESHHLLVRSLGSAGVSRPAVHFRSLQLSSAPHTQLSKIFSGVVARLGPRVGRTWNGLIALCLHEHLPLMPLRTSRRNVTCPAGIDTKPTRTNPKPTLKLLKPHYKPLKPYQQNAEVSEDTGPQPMQPARPGFWVLVKGFNLSYHNRDL